jgi:hypothetical protein
MHEEFCEKTLSEKGKVIMTFINLTPHAIHLNDGRVIEPSGTVARVSSTHTPFDENGVCRVEFGETQNLPEPVEGTIYIVSGMVASATDRSDVVSPATGHPEAKRNEKGQIQSVPGFVRAA